MIIWSSRYEREVLERYFVHKKDLFWGEESFLFFGQKRLRRVADVGFSGLFWAQWPMCPPARRDIGGGL